MAFPVDFPGVRLTRCLVTKHLPTALMLAAYAISLLAFLWLYVRLSGTGLVANFLDWNADATGFLARIFNVDAFVSGNVVTSGPLALEIAPECTSLPFLTIFFAGIIAFPSTITQKLWGAVFGAIALSSLNLIRTTSLLFIGLSFPSAMDSAHIFVWQTIMILAGIVTWVLWWRNIRNRERLQS